MKLLHASDIYARVTIRRIIHLCISARTESSTGNRRSQKLVENGWRTECLDCSERLFFRLFNDCKLGHRGGGETTRVGDIQT